MMSSEAKLLRMTAPRALWLAGALALVPAMGAAEGAGTSGADFMKIGVGARPVAMGEAFAAVALDSNAVHWNPAGLALIERYEASFMHMAHIADINYEAMSISGPLSRLTGWGASINYLWQPPFDSTQNSFGLPTQAAATSSDLAVGLGYGRNFGNYRTTDFNISNIALGASVKLVQRELSGHTANALYGDLGFMAEILEGLRLALVLQNFGTTITFINAADVAPLNSKLGLAWDIRINDANRLLLAYDLNHPIDISNPDYQRWRQNIGAEYWLFGALALRGGYAFGNDLVSMSAGAGFRWSSLGVDYAFVPYRNIGSNHRVSLSWQFGEAMARPDVAAPGVVRGVKGIAGDRLVSLAWQKSPEPDVIGYYVYYTRTPGRNYVRSNDKPEANKTSLDVSLKNDEDYYFVVTAVNAAGKEGEFSSEIKLRPNAPSKPVAPRALKSQVQGRTVTLTWQGVAGKEVVGYNVYYTKEPGKNYRKLNKAVPVTDPEVRLRGLTPGSPYYFVITSVTKEGLESDYSAEVFARPQQDTVGDTAPERPTRRAAQADLDNDPI
jgi:hypothetical protein